MRSDIVLRSDFNFSFVTSTPLRVLFAVDVETAHSKRILSFSALFNLMNGTIIYFELFLLVFYEDGRPITVNSDPFGLPLSFIIGGILILVKLSSVLMLSSEDIEFDNDSFSLVGPILVSSSVIEDRFIFSIFFSVTVLL